MRLLGICLVLFTTLNRSALSPIRAGELDQWAGREASSAVVNPAVRSVLQDVISLRGSWDFATDAQGNGRSSRMDEPRGALAGAPIHRSARMLGSPGRRSAGNERDLGLPLGLRSSPVAERLYGPGLVSSGRFHSESLARQADLAEDGRRPGTRLVLGKRPARSAFGQLLRNLQVRYHGSGCARQGGRGRRLGAQRPSKSQGRG